MNQYEYSKTENIEGEINVNSHQLSEAHERLTVMARRRSLLLVMVILNRAVVSYKLLSASVLKLL